MNDIQRHPERRSPEGPASRPQIKRRWAILGKASGGVAVIAIAGTLAAGAPDPGASGDDGTGASAPELSAES